MTEFVSPMALEFPFGALVVALSKSPSQRVHENVPPLQENVCESVSIRALGVRAHGPDTKGVQQVEVEATLQVAAGVDKLVDLRFDVVVGSDVIGSALVRKVDAEEGKTITKKTSIKVRQLRVDPNLEPRFRVT